MARLNKFLFEVSNLRRIENRNHRSIPITEDAFLKMKEKNCKQAEKNVIYRGIKKGTKEKYLFIEPSEHTRVSEYTENWYMLLMELLPQWKEFPKLSKSIICTTRINEADNWGDIYRVYPYDGAVLAVAPYRHFWGSFDLTMPEVNEVIIMLLKLFKMDIHDNETDPNVLKRALSKIDAMDKSKITTDELSNIFVENIFTSIKYGVPVLKALAKLLPANKFKLIKVGDRIPGNVQVWTESPCLLEYIGEG